MVTGAFLDPNALCGSMSGNPAEDCGTGESGAALASTTGAGRTGGSAAADVATVVSGAKAPGGCTCGSGVAADLCKEGKSSAHIPRTATVIDPTKMRRRFTRSSSFVPAIFH